MKPGVAWPNMHRLAERVILKHLLAAGILHNGNVDDFMKVDMGAVFMPHGLGHLLGMNTHDVGGYLPGTGRSKERGLCWLRTNRTLKAGMVITVEPGCYFNETYIGKQLDNADVAKYVNRSVLKRFMGIGGVRIEDDVLITETGIENLTILPTSADEIEEVMAKAQGAAVKAPEAAHAHHKHEHHDPHSHHRGA